MLGHVAGGASRRVPAPVEAGRRAKRTTALVVRATRAELEAWHACAGASGARTTAGWVRSQLNILADVSASFAPSDAELRELMGELRRVGNNLNQVARRVNVGSAERDNVLWVMEDLRAVLREVSERLR